MTNQKKTHIFFIQVRAS